MSRPITYTPEQLARMPALAARIDSIRHAATVGPDGSLTFDRDSEAYRSVASAVRPIATAAVKPDRWPLWAKAIAKFRERDDAGVGDTFRRMAAKFGGEMYKAFWASLGLPCGCNARQEDWNALYPYETRPPA